MASSEPAAQQANLAQESSTSSQGQAPQEPVPEQAAPGAAEAAKEEEEEGECGFCLFMKAGGCQDAFTAWMDCVEASEKEGGDMVERCAQTTIDLKNCMEAHADYYAPVLHAEQAVSDRAAAAAEAEKDKAGELPAAASTPASAEDTKEGTDSSPAAPGEGKQQEADAEKVDPLSLSN
ncbi:hypothetical protein PR202_ga28325 [Eleusine coracana subsp. coracana]|uniref:GCK domain-containing protein n=1 Tax=Eleusine coracana subsp. coracana TaxID=191504 RepID=A0AAV5DI86_ELECO|nr:hypothetical protein PR202_ga28325 [Eleusine coracana subsp. coracana]